MERIVPAMEKVETISGHLYLATLKVVDKIDIGHGFEGYFICEADGLGTEVRFLDEHYYANTEFVKKGGTVKVALKLLGGFDAERHYGDMSGLDYRDADPDNPWKGFTITGKQGEETYLGHVFDVGIPVHCHFMLMDNLSIIQNARKEGRQPTSAELVRTREGDLVRVFGSMFGYMLKELKLTCTDCGRTTTHMTTTLPIKDELDFDSICLHCGHRDLRNAFPDICGKCQKPMWGWGGKGSEVPMECECGSTMYDFFFDHTPLFVEGPKE